MDFVNTRLKYPSTAMHVNLYLLGRGIGMTIYVMLYLLPTTPKHSISLNSATSLKPVNLSLTDEFLSPFFLCSQAEGFTPGPVRREAGNRRVRSGQRIWMTLFPYESSSLLLRPLAGGCRPTFCFRLHDPRCK